MIAEKAAEDAHDIAAALVWVIASQRSSSGDRSRASVGVDACLSGSSILSGVLGEYTSWQAHATITLIHINTY